MEIVFEKEVEVDIGFLKEIKESITKEKIEVVFCGDEKIKEINKSIRGVDKISDVLSFPLEKVPFSPIGSIVINIDEAKRVSKKLGHTLNEEIALLFIHGLLHLLGFDHEKDNGQMRQKEEEIIKKFNLPESLIIRNDN